MVADGGAGARRQRALTPQNFGATCREDRRSGHPCRVRLLTHREQASVMVVLSVASVALAPVARSSCTIRPSPRATASKPAAQHGLKSCMSSAGRDGWLRMTTPSTPLASWEFIPMRNAKLQGQIHTRACMFVWNPLSAMCASHFKFQVPTRHNFGVLAHVVGNAVSAAYEDHCSE